MFKVVEEEVAANAAGGAAGSMLDVIVRDGARQMLAAALTAEVAAYLDEFSDLRDEDSRRLVVRNGFHAEREVCCS